MTTIAIPDEVYQALVSLADERYVLPDELLATLIAQEQWEEHAANAYDAYHWPGICQFQRMSGQQSF